jgi:hypothetical protein
MIERELKAVTEADLKKLIEDPVREGKTIEYKSELAISTDDQKRKFLAGVASFANASGGDIVFGMIAEDGKPIALKPMTSFNPDADILRLRDLIRAHIQPKVFGFDFRAVELSGGGWALILRIPKTWAGAHMLTYNDDYRFYARDMSGRRLMDVPEIRSAFTLADTTIDKVNRFRLDRLAKIVAGETPEPMAGKSFIIVHLVPLCAFDPTFRADIAAVRRLSNKLPPPRSHGWNHAEDFDGFFTYTPLDKEAASYCYAFRNGCIEAVDATLISIRRNRDDKEYRAISSVVYERELLQTIPKWLDALKSMSVEPPVVLMLSLLGVKDYWMYVDLEFGWDGARAINRDQLLLPGAMIETLDLETTGRTTSNNVFDTMRPMFDQIWNACGYVRSLNFDQDGNWKPRRS